MHSGRRIVVAVSDTARGAGPDDVAVEFERLFQSIYLVFPHSFVIMQDIARFRA